MGVRCRKQYDVAANSTETSSQKSVLRCRKFYGNVVAKIGITLPQILLKRRRKNQYYVAANSIETSPQKNRYYVAANSAETLPQIVLKRCCKVKVTLPRSISLGSGNGTKAEAGIAVSSIAPW